jgi:hypothetical protein
LHANFKFEFLEADLLSWFRCYYRLSPAVRRQRTRYIASWTGIYFGIACIASLYFLTPEAILGSILGAGALSWCAKYSYDFQIDRSAKENAADAALNSGFGPHEIILSETGLREIMPGIDTLVGWQSINDVVVDGNCIYIRLTSGLAAVVCNRNYSGSARFEEIPTVVDEFRQKYGLQNRQTAPAS